MTGSLEACGLFNLLMDAALLAVVARANGCLSFRRVLLCACIAAGYSLLTIAVPALAHPLVQLPLLFPISLILCGSGDAHRWGSVAFQLLCGAALIGGLCALFPPRTLLALCLTLSSALLALHILYAVRRKRMFTWEVRVSLCFQGKSIRFPALIDTGNRLREPMSGLPVLDRRGLAAGRTAGRQARSRADAAGGLRRAGRLRNRALLPSRPRVDLPWRTADSRAGNLGRGLSRAHSRHAARPRAAVLRHHSRKI